MGSPPIGEQPARRHRWAQKRGGGPHDLSQTASKEDSPVWGQLAGAVGDLSRAVTAMSPAVLQTATYALNSAGQCADQFRVPYRALSVISQSSQTLAVSSSPPQVSAPGPGAGLGYVMPRGFGVLNLSGNVFTVYGGQPGDLVTITAYSRPMPPHSSGGPLANQGSTVVAGIAGTVVTAGEAIVSTPALPAGTYTVVATILLTGTPTFADANNVQLKVTATIGGGVTLYPLANNGAAETSVTSAPVTVIIPAGGGVITAQVNTAGGGTASYYANLVVTPVL